jgi:hypothetical protein
MTGVVVGVASLAAIWLVARLAMREDDPFVARIIVLGCAAKLFGSAVRFFVLSDLYDGLGDATRYLDAGHRLAPSIRSGNLPEEAWSTGTPFMEFVAGVYVALFGARPMVAFFVFGFLAYVGALFFLYAFRVAFPDGDHRRYAVLVLLLPTMVFWPSSIGKESWLVLSLGVAAYGAARILRRKSFGYLFLLIGGFATYMVRPHMAALFGASLAAAFLLRWRDNSVRQGVAAWVIGAAAIGVGAAFVLANFAEELPQNQLVEGSAVDRVFAETDRRTSVGGSEFDSRPVRGPGDLVHAFVTVPFRPLPTEAHNTQARLASLEGAGLLLLILLSAKRLKRWPRTAFRRPYVALATVYCLGFIIAFSNVGNFGILTRQRAQLIPLLAVLLALPKAAEAATRLQSASSTALRSGARRGPVLLLKPMHDAPASPDAGLSPESRARTEASGDGS